MDERVKELLDRIRNTAEVAADAAADTARVAGKKAGQMVDAAKLNVQIFDLNSELNDILRQLGQVMYDTHRGVETNSDDLPQLLGKADELNVRIAELRERVAALRQSRTCAACGAVCGREDQFCRACGEKLS